MSQPPPYKIAFLNHPLPYGLYTVFRHLRTGLTQYGYDLRWVGAGDEAASVLTDPRWKEDLAFGHVLPAEGKTDAQRGRALLDHLLSSNYQGLVVNPPQTAIELNIVRYLPPQFLRIFILHHMARGACIQAASIGNYVHAAVGCSPRVQQELIQNFHFPPEITFSIPNAIDTAAFSADARSSDPTLRLLFLGRIDHASKGVLFLPGIMRKLKSRNVRLTIIGGGPDLEKLKARCAPLGDRVRFGGVISPYDVPAELQKHDAFILPSPHEGLPCALLEAMAAACVPLATRIRNCTDFVIRHGESGFVFPYGNEAAAARFIDQLAQDPALTKRLAVNARHDALTRFSVGPFAKAYASLFDSLRANRRPLPEPIPIDNWKYPQMGGSLVRRLVPARVKNILRPFTFRP